MKKDNMKVTWESHLAGLQKAIDSKATPESTKIQIAIGLLELSLERLAKLEMLAKLAVEIEAYYEGNKRIVWKYALGMKEDEESESGEVAYIKKSKLEEDE